MTVEKLIIKENMFIKKQELLKELTDNAYLLIEISFDILNFDKKKYDKIKARQEEIKQEIDAINEQFDAIDLVMGVDEASQIWELSAGYIKNLCAEGKIKSKKIGKTWIIDKFQPNPSKSSE
jgi:hypothetical protein